MLAKVTGMTQRPRALIRRYDRLVLECSEGGRTGVTEAVMPQGRRSGKVATVGWGRRNGVEFPATIAAKNHAPRPLVLNRKTQSVKLDRTIIVTSELANRKQIAH